MRLVVTIDVEEDDWGGSRSRSCTVENVKRLPALHALLTDFSVKPTYLVTYPVTTDRAAVSVLRRLVDSGDCEIGAHCHPWNTPPLVEEQTRNNRMLCNLPRDLRYLKIKALHSSIREQLGVTPVSFRSGRWGYGPGVAGVLRELGYRVDTSITPYTDWSACEGPDFSARPPDVYRFEADDIFRRKPAGPLLEVPATIGFLQPNFDVCNAVLRGLSREPMSTLRLVGVFDRLRLLNKVWLSPELSDAQQMIALTRTMMRRGAGVVNLVFHSPALVAGLTPFVSTEEEEVTIRHRVASYLAFTSASGIEPLTLSELSRLV